MPMLGGIPDPQRTELGGQTLEHVLAGDGEPLIVLVNGSGGPLESWHKLFMTLAAESAVLAYHRPGVGRSSAPRRPQTLAAMVEDLAALLDRLRPAARLILVGHSLGGLIVNLFARLHPQRVAGVVLLEASSADDVLQLPQHESWLQRALKRLAQRLFPLPAHHETNHLRASVLALEKAPPFPSVPLRVISGARPAMAWATRTEALALRALHQRQLLALSPLASQQMATASGHFPQMSEPALVSRIILDLLTLCRSGQPSTHHGQP
jgi:pimeloyl-ACP methyl ester carboxylesterase